MNIIPHNVQPFGSGEVNLKRYEHKYKAGKKKKVIPLDIIKRKVEKAALVPEHLAYFWLLYWTGVRKSEGFERLVTDFEVTPDLLIVDFHKRKKGGAEVDALEVPRSLFGVDLIVEWVERIRKRDRVRVRKIYVYQDKKRVAVKRKGVWVFPHIQSTTAWNIVKKVLGDGYYPHFLRLNRLTEVGSDPTGNITRMKSFSGIKSLKSIQAYMGTDRREQKAAFRFLENKQKET